MKNLYDLMEQYLEWRKSLLLSPATIKKNRHGIMLFIKWIDETFMVKTVDQIITEHLHSWQKHVASKTTKSGNPVKAGTINTYHENVKTWLEYLASLGYVKKGLADEIRYVRVPYRLPGSVLTHAEMRTLLEKIPTCNSIGYRDRAMLELLYSAGIRAGELLGLDVDDIDFKHQTIVVIGKGNKQKIVPLGKTASRHLQSTIRRKLIHSVIRGRGIRNNAVRN